MRLTFKELKQYPVETVSGVVLGYVHEIVLEDETQTVAQYAVRSSMFAHDCLVSRNQVVAFREGKMIVDDSVKRVQGDQSDTKKPATNPEPISMRA